MSEKKAVQARTAVGCVEVGVCDYRERPHLEVQNDARDS